MNKKKPGVTLLEVIIALAITIMVLAIAGAMFTAGNKVYSDSDVKSTLQIEGQAIQEKISDIGMQGIDVEDVSPKVQSGEVDYLILKSYINGENDNIPKYFKIKKDGKKLIIDRYSDNDCSNAGNIQSSQTISENIDSLQISRTDKSIHFDIELKKTKGFSRDITNEIAFTLNFRNKEN